MKKVCLSSAHPAPAVRPPRWFVGVLLAAVVAPSVVFGGHMPAEPRMSVEGRREGRATRAYLTAIGPIPLRIRRPSVPGPVVVLPPLAMRDPVPSAEATRTNLTAEIPKPASTGPSGDPDMGGAEESSSTGLDASTTDSSGADARVTPIVTPSMLVQYFKPTGTNAPGAGFAVPVFVPATPPVSTGGRSSSATYRLR